MAAWAFPNERKLSSVFGGKTNRVGRRRVLTVGTFAQDLALKRNQRLRRIEIPTT
jgi:hypothetical protein